MSQQLQLYAALPHSSVLLRALPHFQGLPYFQVLEQLQQQQHFALGFVEGLYCVGPEKPPSRTSHVAVSFRSGFQVNIAEKLLADDSQNKLGLILLPQLLILLLVYQSADVLQNLLIAMHSAQGLQIINDTFALLLVVFNL